MYDVVFIGDNIAASPELETAAINAQQLVSCRGEIGDFKIKYREQGKNNQILEEKTKTIVINIKARRKSPFCGNVYTFDDDPEAVQSDDDLIFIQDYEDLSPAIMSSQGLNKALLFNEKHPENEVYYCYRSLRFIEDNDRLFEKARRQGIIFLKFEPENFEINIDNNEIIYKREDISLKLQGKIMMAPVIESDEILSRIARILNLEMGTDGFLQPENIYLQPTASGKRGIYVLGGARGITAISRFNEESEITLNHIKSLIKDIKPVTEKEREIDDQKCILCYTCYRVCPHGALEPDQELDAMQINELACEGCDACISHCPASAISIVEEKDEKESSGLKVYLCENSAEIALNNLDQEQFKDIKFNTIPCSSSLEKQDLYRELKDKDDKLLILGCFQESCKHINGDQRGERIINQVKNTLSELELGEERLIFERMSPRMVSDLELLLSRWKEGKLD